MNKKGEYYEKNIAIILSGIVILMSMASVTIGAESMYISNGSRYEEVTILSEICSSRADKIIMSANCDSSDASYYALFAGVSEGKAYAFCSPVSLVFDLYSSLNEEEAELLKNYISENCPEISIKEEKIYDSLEGTSISITIEYTTELSNAEKLDLAIEIYKSIGLYFEILFNDIAIFGFSLLGDLSSDNALTPVDASMLLSYYSDSQSGVAVASAESGADYSIIGDFNGDGAVTPTDAAEILQYYADQQTGQ